MILLILCNVSENQYIIAILKNFKLFLKQLYNKKFKNKNNMNKTYLTSEGMEKIKKELLHLRTIETKECLEAIEEARKGDASENEEFNTAKENYENLNAKISKLNAILSNSITINENSITTDKIGLLNIVCIKNLKNNKTYQYTLVPGLESDLKNFKLSSSGPLGNALMNKCVGDIVKVNTPSGEIGYEILTIKK